jgi:hypothetical protein
MLTKPKGNYSSDDLAMLSSILKEALEASTDGAGLTELHIQERASRLGKVIMDNFTAGETDPEALKNAAMESIKLSGQ